MERDEIFMKKAVQAARKGLGMTSPNPAVGAVIVRDDKVISTGYHKKAVNHAKWRHLATWKEECGHVITM
jgi:diaminohydroxyphosphoribosylaminopyrimidine deaminase/5-amino-6-(5-phosphoribosylamino)uracil reductase